MVPKRRRPGTHGSPLAAGGTVLAIVAGLLVLSVTTVGLMRSSTGSAAAVTARAATSDTGEEQVPSTAGTASGANGDAPAATAQVATATVTLVDPTRSTAARGSTPASSSRTLTVTISYPVTDVGTRFPLVVFVHGYDVDAATYADLEREIAEQGFVVAAPDFPLSSSAVDGEAERDIVDQAGDVSFVITSLLDESTRPAALADLIADTKVGVIGHSDGAVSAAGVGFNDADVDARVGAVVTLSGAEAFFPGSWFGSGATEPALLAIHGTDDDVNPFAASRTLFDDATGPKWLVGVTGGAHLAPFTTDPVRAGVATLAATFFRAELEGDAEAFATVDLAAGAPGLALVATG
jgi:predicted esterase